MKLKFTFAFLAIIFSVKSQIPKLNSLSGSSYVIYLDFDGATVTGTSWNSIYNYGNPIYAAASSQSNTGITNVWKEVSEEFRPFNINITTDSTVYNSASSGQRMWVVVTPTDTWFGTAAGGVAFLNSFTWSSKTPCWCFENNLAYTARYIAECCSHEVGHTLGLNHQSSYNSSCTKTAEYNIGNGSGEIGWAPTMGASYYQNFGVWHNGRSTYGCNILQDDLNIITTSNGFGYRSDDCGNTIATAKFLNMTSTTFDTAGIIHDSDDVDMFRVDFPASNTISITATPFNLGASNYLANLDIELTLYDSAGTQIAQNNGSTVLNAAINSQSVSAGKYYIKIDGVGSANYTDYGSLGYYSINITAATPLSFDKIDWKIIVKNSGKYILINQFNPEKYMYKLEVSKDGNSFSEICQITTNNFFVHFAPSIKYVRIVTYENGIEKISDAVKLVDINKLFTIDENNKKITVFENNKNMQIANSLGQIILTKHQNIIDYSNFSGGIYYLYFSNNPRVSFAFLVKN